MSINQLEDMQTFIRIVDAGSITKAADQLDMAKSAISKRLAELEKRLGVTLLTRTTRTQTLTDSGHEYYQACAQIIEQVAEIESTIKQQDCALKGRIRIAGPLSFGLTHLASALRIFSEVNPEIIFDIDFNDRKVDLVEEGFDLAIRIGAVTNLASSSLMARKLAVGRAILCASPAYLEEHGTPNNAEDLNHGHHRLIYSLSTADWPLLNNNGKKISLKMPVGISANNGDFLLQEAIDGKGIVMSPDFICYKAIKTGLLLPVLWDRTIQDEMGVYAMYPQTKHLSNRVRSLIDFLVAYFGDEPYWHVAIDL